MAPSEVNALYLQIRKRLIETGNGSSEIRAIMAAKLNESGWCDDMHHKSKGISGRFRVVMYRPVLTLVLTLTISASVPLAVKREVSSVIRQHLEKQFE
ncbi:hypothetical protein BJ912DRAFT_960455 [Pholiota molesta]|nr:hypothetical protein BJ912DRAFT_960455 [Pholiota molesta]